MGMKPPIEGRPLMLEQIEEHERLQQFAQIGRAHQACDRAVLPASGALRNPAYSRLCSRGVFMRKVHFVSFKKIHWMVSKARFKTLRSTAESCFATSS